MKAQRLIAVALAVCAPVASTNALADDQAETVKALMKRIDELEHKVKTLEQKQDAEGESEKKPAATLSIGEQGIGFKSADGNFGLKIRGVVQADSRTFFRDHGIVGNDGFILRKLRPIIEGTVCRDFDFYMLSDFGGGTTAALSTPVVLDAYVNYRLRPELQLRVGKFKSPVGLELLQGDGDTWFNERSLATDLVPNRDMGVQLHGELFDGRLNYAAGIFNGVGDNRSTFNVDYDDTKAFAGRIFAQPFRKAASSWLGGLGFGLGGSYGSEHPVAGNSANALPNYLTDGQQNFFAYNPTGGAVINANGEHWRLSPQGYYFYGPFGLMGEYVISDQRVTRTGAAPLVSARLQNTGWQVTASYVLTGEDASYQSVVPARPFDPFAGQWGAWQVLARYAALDIDNNAFPLFSNPATSASGAQEWSVGLNWWLNRNVRVLTSFSHTTFTGGGAGIPPATTAPGIVTRQPENIFFTRMQLSF